MYRLFKKLVYVMTDQKEKKKKKRVCEKKTR